jgi:hypothetical protein
MKAFSVAIPIAIVAALLASAAPLYAQAREDARKRADGGREQIRAMHLPSLTGPRRAVTLPGSALIEWM